MSRPVTRKDFLIFSAASAGSALMTAACSDDPTTPGLGAGGSGGSAGNASAGSAGSSSGGSSSGGSSAGGANSVSGSGGGGVPGGGSGGTAGQTGGGSAGSGQSGGSAGSGGNSGGSCGADVVALISCPHEPEMHSLTVPAADIAAGTTKMYDIRGDVTTHGHEIELSAEDFTTLQGGGTVFKFVTGQTQDHCITISCGQAGDPHQAPVCGAGGQDMPFSCE